MIIDTLLNICYAFVAFLIGLFPDSQGFPPEAVEAAQTIGGYAGIFNPIISVSTLGLTLGLVFAVEIGIFGFKTFKWLFGHIPIIGGKG